MASLLEKVSTLISANLHSMVDSALKANSLAVFDEYIRQAENNLDALEDAAATIGGNVKTLKRKVDQYQADASKLDAQIDELLRQGKEDLAAAVQSKLNSTTGLLTQYKTDYERTQVEYQKLLDSKLKLEAKMTTIKQQREEMEALLELAKAKEKTVGAIRSLKDLEGVGDADIARVTEGIRARLDKADARAEMATSRLSEQVDDALGRAEIDIQLAERKRRLGME
ncbi:MAG: PspA/IM30 family protein [Thermoflexales bacterium]|nr:PspA/IM30 family protein [Thermoflexales bacterium]